MATRKKADSTLLKEARVRIEELEKELEAKKSLAEMWHNKYTTLDREVQSVHTALDSVGVPREIKSPGGYCSTTTMDLTARLFAWRMGARLSEQLENT
jgi:hypothetical protein